MNEAFINKHFEQTQKVLTKLDSKQTEHDAKISKILSDIAPLKNMSAIEEASNKKIISGKFHATIIHIIIKKLNLFNIFFSD